MKRGRFLFYILCLVISVFCLLSVLSPYAMAAENEKKPALQFTKNPDISQIKPRKPVKIKLHRSGKGEYQWDISGDNADDVVRADKRLRKLLEVE